MIKICKSCHLAHCDICHVYGQVTAGGMKNIVGTQRCKHTNWKLIACTDCKCRNKNCDCGYVHRGEQTITEAETEAMRVMLLGGCANGYHELTDDMESPLTLAQYPGAEYGAIEGFKCMNCGCTGHIKITARSVYWMDKKEMELIEAHEAQTND
mgnify:CR=1 FL=1